MRGPIGDIGISLRQPAWVGRGVIGFMFLFHPPLQHLRNCTIMLPWIYFFQIIIQLHFGHGNGRKFLRTSIQL